MKITLHELYKAYGGRDLFTNFSLDIEDGMHLCVCGPNGMGKSTLLRLIAGEEVPDAGRVLLPSGCRLGYVEQEFTDEALETTLLTYVLDVVHDWNEFWSDWDEATKNNDEEQLKVLMQRQSELEASVGYNPEQRAKQVLSGLGFSEEKWHRTLGQLSGGWRERAKLARVLTAGADILLLDEPTNHLDIDAVEWLEDFLKGFQGALVFVAHDRVFMDNVGSHVLYLGGGKPIFRKANYSQFLRLQEEYEVQREREKRALQDDMNKKMAFVDRFRYKATKARQAGSRLKQVKKLAKELEGYKPEPKRRELKFAWPEAPRSEKVLFHAIDMAFSFPDGKSMWPPLNFSVFSGQRIAFVGHNGCGKSTLIKLLADKLCLTSGILQRSTSAKVGYYAQHQMELLRPGYTVLAQMRAMSDPHTSEEELMSVLGLFLLGQSFFDRQVDSLSGGEKCRLVLASLFLQRCNLLLLDEPTNHLDLESREALANALSHYQGTLVMVAHDRWLLQETGCTIWAVDEQGITEYDSFASYDAARHALEQNADSADKQPEKEKAAAQPAAAAADQNAVPRQNLTREEAKKLKREQAEARNALARKLKPLKEKQGALEKELNDVMTEQHETEQKLADPETYADKELSTRLLNRYNELKDRCDFLLEELDTLEGELANLEQGN